MTRMLRLEVKKLMAFRSGYGIFGRSKGAPCGCFVEKALARVELWVSECYQRGGMHNNRYKSLLECIDEIQIEIDKQEGRESKKPSRE